MLTLAGLKRYLVFFVIELRSRRVHIAGIHPQPDGAWMEQLARNLTDPVDGFLRTARHLIHDRDPLYTKAYREILTSGGVHPIRLPPKSPNLNAYAERFVRSIKEECLQRVVPLGEGHLRLLVREYVEHYNHERNHQGLDNQLLQHPSCRTGGRRCISRLLGCTDGRTPRRNHPRTNPAWSGVSDVIFSIESTALEYPEAEQNEFLIFLDIEYLRRPPSEACLLAIHDRVGLAAVCGEPLPKATRQYTLHLRLPANPCREGSRR